MIRDTSELYENYDNLDIGDKTRLLRSGSDIIQAAYKIDDETANSQQLNRRCDSTSWEIGNTFRALERLYETEYEHSHEELIVWNLEKLRMEETLDDLDSMLSPESENAL